MYAKLRDTQERTTNIVGILVDQRIFQQIKSGKTGNEKLHLYNRAAAKLGLIPFYLSLAQISQSSNKTYGYKYVKGRYRYVRANLPKVIHNRAMPSSKKMEQRLRYLRKKSFVFNSKTRYSKYRIHKLLQGSFSTYLPHTIRYSKSNMRDMMQRYHSLYIKPFKSSVGEGIMKATRLASRRWKLHLPKGTMVAQKSAIVQRIGKIARNQNYLVQEAIPLARYRGKPYDIRVSVQRGGEGRWDVTGMVGKVARKGRHVTNVARGGKVKDCTILFQHSSLNPAMTSYAVKQLSLDITRYLGERLNRLADVGLDIGVTGTGKPYFIEMNCRDQRYSFKQAKMTKTFHKTYENPMKYAKFLLSGETRH